MSIDHLIDRSDPQSWQRFLAQVSGDPFQPLTEHEMQRKVAREGEGNGPNNLHNGHIGEQNG